MAEVRYLVVKRNDGWRIVTGSSRLGPFADRLAAIDAAIELADRTGRDGRDSQVLVRADDRQLRIEWTYGRDPFPELLSHPAPKAPPPRRAESAQRRKSAVGRQPSGLVHAPVA